MSIEMCRWWIVTDDGDYENEHVHVVDMVSNEDDDENGHVDVVDIM